MHFFLGTLRVKYSFFCQQKLSTKVQDSLADANKVAEEACSTMKTVRSFANEVGETARYAASLDKTYQLNKKQAVLYAGFVWVTQVRYLNP